MILLLLYFPVLLMYSIHINVNILVPSYELARVVPHPLNLLNLLLFSKVSFGVLLIFGI